MTTTPKKVPDVPDCWSDNGIDVCVTAERPTIQNYTTIRGLDESTWR